jgi:hypothetical protein
MLLKPFRRRLHDTLARVAPRTAGRLRARFGRKAPAQPAPDAPFDLPSAFMVDQLWCDIFGIYISGWAHAHQHPVRRLVFTCGGESATVEEFHSRPDILNFYPEFAHVAETGFEAYLPFPPFQPLRMTIVTDAGSATVDITVPPHLMQAAEAGAALPGPPRDVFCAAMRERSGVVLEIGARVIGDMTANTAAELGPECRYIGFDIHPAPGVDVVGDAHELSRCVGRGTIDGVISESVLEHIVVPWLVAAEINRALRLGGLSLQIVPQTWPIHEMPNDFWRMSDEGLKILFGPALGFEVVTSGMCGPSKVIPSLNNRVGSWRSMPTVPGYGCAYVLSRKVADIPDDAVRWPLAAQTITERSQDYPRH